MFLKSSAALGKKESAREKLRTAFLLERRGFHVDDADDVRLYDEYEVEDVVPPVDDETQLVVGGREHTMDMGKDDDQVNGVSLIEQAFAERKPEFTVVDYSNEPTTDQSKERQVQTQGQSKEKQVEIQGQSKEKQVETQAVAFGSALKRSNPEGSAPSKRRKKKKPETEQQQKPFAIKKGLWATDVKQGELVKDNIPKELVQVSRAVLQERSKKEAEQVVCKDKQTNGPTDAKAAFYVPVNRIEPLKSARLKLPVVGEEQPIMEAIKANDVVILCGETGSGKTTQVPQFLYEAGFGDPGHPEYPGMVGVTQPRRVAAVSMSERVAQEMNLNDGTVAYQIRYDSSSVTEKTRIKFMTDGILLRELSLAATGTSTTGDTAHDLLLTKYSCIIIDEAHERTVVSDILIGWLTRIARLRNSQASTQGKGVKPLKIVIMSATLRVQDFTENKTLFPVSQRIPPVLKVDGRQFKVTIHYNKTTPLNDYVSEAYKKVSRIHRRLPHGGILVFLTGRQEIEQLVSRLRSDFGSQEKNYRKIKALEKREMEDEMDESLTNAWFEQEDVCEGTEGFDDFDEITRQEEEDDEDDEEEEVHVLPGESDDEEQKDHFPSRGRTTGPLHVLPLYSLLPTKAQMRIFENPPPGHRLCVVATNVAETSLTIPGIKYVVDAGKVKQRKCDVVSGANKFQVDWTSKASADQRAGRAGRVSAGHCYRLYSSAVFNDKFPLFSLPEILLLPIDGVVLQMKSMGINQVLNFPFPTPPDRNSLEQAESLLRKLDALDDKGRITWTGKAMSQFPLAPRLAKMLLVALQQQKEKVLGLVLMIVCAMTVGQVLVQLNPASEDMDEQQREPIENDNVPKSERKEYFSMMQIYAGDSPNSDAIRLLRAVGSYMAYIRNPKKKTQSRTKEQLETYCKKHFLRFKAMDEFVKLFDQIKAILLKNFDKSKYPSLESLEPEHLVPPCPTQNAVIRQIVMASYIDHIVQLNPSRTFGKNRTPVYEYFGVKGNQRPLLVHISSCIYPTRPAPRFLVYEELVEKEKRHFVDSSESEEQNKETGPLFIKGVSVIHEKWIPR